MIIGLNCNKSNLNGSIPTNVLKDKCDAFILYITEIINHSFQTWNFPQRFETSRVYAAIQKERSP